jgi:hypothetical protein
VNARWIGFLERARRNLKSIRNEVRGKETKYYGLCSARQVIRTGKESKLGKSCGSLLLVFSKFLTVVVPDNFDPHLQSVSPLFYSSDCSSSLLLASRGALWRTSCMAVFSDNSLQSTVHWDRFPNENWAKV